MKGVPHLFVFPDLTVQHVDDVMPDTILRIDHLEGHERAKEDHETQCDDDDAGGKTAEPQRRAGSLTGAGQRKAHVGRIAAARRWIRSASPLFPSAR